MKGNNELHLNTATMIEAMQQWLDAKMTHAAPTVTDVRVLEKTDRTFIVSVSDSADRHVPCISASDVRS